MAEPTYAQVRAWALEHGHHLPDKRIPAAVVAAYFDAHPEATRPPRTPQHVPARNGSASATAPQEAPVTTAATSPPPPGSGAAGPAGSGSPPPPPPPPPPPRTPPPPVPPAAAAPPSGPQPVTPPAPPGRSSGVDPFAIVALVLGLIPGLCLLGIAFGVAALVRTRRSGRGGRALAVLGILAGIGWTVVIGAVIGIAVSQAPERAADGSVTGSGTVAVADLRVGDCPTTLPDGSARTVRVVPCAQPHHAEVYAAFNLDQPTFPGESEVARFASGGCRSRLTSFVGEARRDAFEIYFIAPEAATWRLGDREVLCMLAPAGGGELPAGTARAR